MRRTPFAIPLVLILAACGLADATTPAPSAAPPESALVPGAYANPLDPVLYPDPTQQSLVDAALEAEVTACLAAAGFAYLPGTAVPARRPVDDAQYVYTVTDPEVAATFGFHAASWVAELDTPRPAPTPAPPGYEAALFGDPEAVPVTDEMGTVIATYDPASCLGRAEDAVTPHWAQARRIEQAAADILLRVADLVDRDEAVRAARADWSRCMAASGYGYPDPFTASNEFATDLPTAAEIQVAVASAGCLASSGLLRTWSLRRAELTQAELDRAPGLLTEWLEIQREEAR